MQPQEQTNLPKPSNKKFLIPIIILAALSLGLGGYLVYDKVINPSTDKNISNSNDNTNNVDNPTTSDTNEVTIVSEAAFAQDKKLHFPNNTILSEKSWEIVDSINHRYPEYISISSPMYIFGRLTINNGGHISGSELFNKVANEHWLAYLLTHLFGGYVDNHKPAVDNTIKSIFGVENPEPLLLNNGYSVEDDKYVAAPGGIGDGCFPISFLSGITKTKDNTILTYNYAVGSDPDGSCNTYTITHTLQVTLTSNDSTEIQIKSIDVVE